MFPSMPIAYFITFATYGSHLPGNSTVSTSRRQNGFGEPTVPEHAGLEHVMRELMKHDPVVLDSARRHAVDEAIRDRCSFRGWALHALNVRTNHVHVVVSAENESPEHVMEQLKSRATRLLRTRQFIGNEEPVWARHGSTRKLWSETVVAEASEYVLFGQGVNLA